MRELNIREYHESISKELDIIKNRVRNLVQNWSEDGRYKEAILKNIIKRFLPKKYEIGTGFVVKKEDRQDNHKASGQIDLIIYDTHYPVLFSEGDFVIITPEAVRGIIEVKTRLRNRSSLSEAIRKSCKIGKFIFKGKKNKNPIFNGIFSYEGFENTNRNNCQNIVNLIKNILYEFMNEDNEAKNYVVNHISLNRDIFIKSWQFENKLSIYKLRNLSFSYFISNLIYYITDEPIIHERDMWFPINKENYDLCSVYIK